MNKTKYLSINKITNNKSIAIYAIDNINLTFEVKVYKDLNKKCLIKLFKKLFLSLKSYSLNIFVN